MKTVAYLRVSTAQQDVRSQRLAILECWDTVFPNASCSVALIDRLTHHVEIPACVSPAPAS